MRIAPEWTASSDSPGVPVPELDGGLPVLLLRTDRNLLHHGTLGAIRSLGRAGVEVHAVLEGRASPAAHSRRLRRRHPWGPSPYREPEALAEHLRMVAARIGRRALLIPLDDAGAIFTAEHAKALEECYLLPRQDPAAPRRVADKSLLLEQCDRYDIACPESLVPETPAEVDEAAAALGLPLVAKWSRPWLLPRGLRSTEVIRSTAEARRLFARSLGDEDDGFAAGPLILQRLVPSGGGDWFFHGHFDENYVCLFGGTGIKHLSHPPGAGPTVRGEWVLNPELEQLACKVVNILGCRGTVDLDFRLDPRTGTYHLLDFNPRLGAQFRLFCDERGIDLVRAVHLERSGRAVPAPLPRYGRTFLVEHHFLRHALSRRGERAGAFRRVRKAGERAWLAADDPVPFLVMGRRSLIRAVRRTT
ncbi:ATP-grasp domain-containing protein [Spirillospora sp. NPDC029432]|uniref:carboxylate--amine ligase n=1 Tax=Spirillospora sp. NPDC029432 TaxID=3154599 RepID=UPI0034549747